MSAPITTLSEYLSRNGWRNGKISEMKKTGMTCGEIGKEFGLGRQQVSQILKRIKQMKKKIKNGNSIRELGRIQGFPEDIYNEWM